MRSTSLLVDGARLHLAKRIGKGGEGEVFAVQDDPTCAVKLYKTSTDGRREAKIKAMISARMADRSRLIAFPRQIVQNAEGKFVGFTMDLVQGHKHLFDLYSPGARKRHFPGQDYRFLVRAAINIAKAVAEVHEAGCVIGDINHSGILVSDQAVAALIDADSFQVIDGATKHLCGVGVKEYTPPELHRKSLASIIRTPNHDAFGLAVVIFQLLCMGRHPFVGSYAQGEMPIETAVAEVRFAYSLRRRVGMTPPPGAVRLSDFPQNIGSAFENAFGPVNVGARPSPQIWIELLSELEEQLKTCASNAQHFFPNVARECPWCRMENALAIKLFPSKSDAIPELLDVEKIWNSIESIKIPSRIPAAPLLATPRTTPSREAAKLARQRKMRVPAAALMGAGGAVLILNPELSLGWAPALSLGGLYFFLEFSRARSLARRSKSAHRLWQLTLSEWQRRNAGDRVHQLKAQLAQSRAEFAKVANRGRHRPNDTHAGATEARRRQFLEKFRVERVDVPGIGPGKIAVLASYGIETAADIRYEKIVGIQGFGQASAKTLADWRSALELQFATSNPIGASETSEPMRLRQEFASKVIQLRRKLERGATELRSAVSELSARRQSGDSALRLSYARLYQAETDWSYLSSSASRRTVRPSVFLAAGVPMIAGLALFIANTVPDAFRNITPSAFAKFASEEPSVTAYETPRAYLVAPPDHETVLVNLRRGPGVEFDTVSMTPVGVQLVGTGEAVLDDGSAWVAVNRSDGMKGYIAASLLRDITTSSSRNCQKMDIWEDKEVCSNPELWRLELEMRRRISTLAATLPREHRSILHLEDSHWRSRRAECALSAASASCLLAMYEVRLEQLKDAPQQLQSLIPIADAEEKAGEEAPPVRSSRTADNSDQLILPGKSAQRQQPRLSRLSLERADALRRTSLPESAEPRDE